MAELFYRIADMSISAGWVVLAVLVARLLTRKAPKWINCALWALVAVRLVCPFSLESVFSLVPQTSPISASVEEFQIQEIPEKIQTLDFSDMPAGSIMSVQYEDEAGKSQVIEVYQDEDGTVKAVEPPSSPYVSWEDVLPLVWVGGVLLMVLYAAWSYLRILKKVQVSVNIGNGVFICDYIDTPFILGIVKPKIFLPSAMDPKDAAHVLAHERAHLKRKDHWWKPMGYLLLAVYWFHPLLWVAYILLCRDIELACDEKVIRDLGSREKMAYSEALLKCSVPRHMVLACPLAFGEVSVKERVKSILHYKKPGFWILLISVILVAVVALCFLTDAPEVELHSPFEEQLWVTELVYSHSGEPLYNAPSSLLDSFTLTEDGGFSAISTYWQPFVKTELTESNFDSLFESAGEWYSLSPEKLRKQNVNAWVLNDTTSYASNQLNYPFYYLLQQKNGDLYLTRGQVWSGQLRPGKTYIRWVFKLDTATVTQPFQDGDSPFVYTRTIDGNHLDVHHWADSTIRAFYEDDVNVDEHKIYISELIDILHCIPENAFSLGSPIKDVECSIDLDVGQSGMYDVTLRYGEGKVEIDFSDTCPWSFADTGDRVWHIDYDGLNEFFARYSRRNTLPEYLQKPMELHKWRKNIDVSELKWATVSIIAPMRHNYGYSMNTAQAKTLLKELKKLPDTAFVPADGRPEPFEELEAGAISLYWYYPAYIENEDTMRAELTYVDGTAYFGFYEWGNRNPAQTWVIQDDTFTAYLSTLFDPSIPNDGYSQEAATGTVSVSHELGSIKLNTYEYMDYEVIDYTDDETPFGIRMKPKLVEDGWISVYYYPKGFTADPSWDNKTRGSMNGYDCIWYIPEDQIQGDIYNWGAIHFTKLSGDYVILKEGLSQWCREFYMEADTIFTDMVLGGNTMTKDEILEIARSTLGSTSTNVLFVDVDGVQRIADASFDSETGLWIIATPEILNRESVVVLKLDAYGNVIE